MGDKGEKNANELKIIESGLWAQGGSETIISTFIYVWNFP